MIEILANRVIVEISGKDAQKFLQNLTTNNLLPQKLIYTYMLNAQGRYLFDFFIYSKCSQIYLIDIAKANSSALLLHLKMFKLRAEVEISLEKHKYKIIYSDQFLNTNSVYSEQDPRHEKLGKRSLVLAEHEPMQNLCNNLYLRDKYNLAIPDGESDLASGKSLPMEYGAEELNAISYDKGCYIGQEVVSRTKYQGVLRKKIFKITSEISLNDIPQGTELTAQDTGQKMGVFCSNLGNQGIALIKEEYVNENDNIFLNEIPVMIKAPIWRDKA